MALQKNVTVMTEVGEEVTINNTYIKIAYVYGDKNVMNSTVAYYRNAGDESPYKTEKYKFTPDLDSNFIKQGYEHLKTLDQFSDAEDV